MIIILNVLDPELQVILNQCNFKQVTLNQWLKAN